jgi:hypothetical protein
MNGVNILNRILNFKAPLEKQNISFSWTLIPGKYYFKNSCKYLLNQLWLAVASIHMSNSVYKVVTLLIIVSFKTWDAGVDEGGCIENNKC